MKLARIAVRVKVVVNTSPPPPPPPHLFFLVEYKNSYIRRKNSLVHSAKEITPRPLANNYSHNQAALIGT